MQTQPDRTQPDALAGESQADALACAAAICARYGLDVSAVIGAADIPPAGLEQDALLRIGAVFAVDFGLVVVLGEQQGKAWLHAKNTGVAFAGRSPAEVMERDGLDGLLAVRAVLDAMRVGRFAAAQPARLRVVS